MGALRRNCSTRRYCEGKAMTEQPQKQDRLALILNFIERMKWWILAVAIIGLLMYADLLPTTPSEAKEWLESVGGFVERLND